MTNSLELPMMAAVPKPLAPCACVSLIRSDYVLSFIPCAPSAYMVLLAYVDPFGFLQQQRVPRLHKQQRHRQRAARQFIGQ
jgi:hypothetical protein